MHEKIGFYSTSIKKIYFNKLGGISSIDFRTDGLVCFKMVDGQKLVYSEENKPRFKTEETGEEVVEYSGAATDGNMDRSFAIAYFKQGAYSPNHHHNERTEIYFITAGEAKLIIDGEKHQLKAGDSITIKPGQKHQVFNIGDGMLELIVLCTPAWVFSDHILEQTIENTELKLV
ncbi:MAG: cupin domain-containing protein [Tatlockia sp.]|nr:cupin domain-containing protein [Tatlockia sp.]